jgi:hypothetical protein
MFDEQNKIFDDLNTQLNVCNDYLNKHDIKGFFVNLRISAELVCRYIIVSEKKEEEFEHVFLKELSIRFKGREQYCSYHTMALFLFEKNIVPYYIYYLLEFIRKSCNEPAHNVLSTEEEKFLLTPNKSSYNNLFYWFFKTYLKQSIPEDFKDLLNDYQIENSFSLFLIPFKLNTTIFTFQDFYNQLDQSIWQPAGKNELLNDYFLFNHVDKFLRANNEHKSPEDIHTDKMISFTLKDNKNHKVNLLKNLFLNNSHHINDIEAEFRLSPSGELSPMLHFVPDFSVCLISFGLSLKNLTQTLQKIIDFNYLLKGFEWENVDIRTKKNLHQKANENNEKINGLIKSELNKHFKIKDPITTEESCFIWNMNLFMNYLLIDFPEESINKILPNKFNIFTFAKSQEQIPKAKLGKLLTLLSSVYNTNFRPTKGFISRNVRLSQPFEQIYYASSNEGAVVLQNHDKEYNLPFFEDFQSVISNRYFWIYKYVFLQKILLLLGIEKLSEFPDQNNNDIKDSLPDVYNILSVCDSEKISNTSSINQFYSNIRSGMNIGQLYKQLFQKYKMSCKK